MSETNEAKEPGQVAYEAYAEHTGGKTFDGREMPKWADLGRIQGAWGAAVAPLAKTVAQLEAETRDLHRQLSELRVEAQAQRAGRVEAEHQRDVLVGRVGREVLAVASYEEVAGLRARVAELEAFEGSQAEAAMKGAQEVAVLTERAQKAERERDEARAVHEAARKDEDRMCYERNVARTELAEARAEVARLTAHLNPRPDAGLAGLAEREAVAEVKPGKVEPPATQAESVRQPAPDLRRGDRVKDRYGREWTVDAGEPLWLLAVPGWVVPVDDGECRHVRVEHLDLSTRVRTWQPGEVVPHAPHDVGRRRERMPADGESLDSWWRSLPLAEPWTQTGVTP